MRMGVGPRRSAVVVQGCSELHRDIWRWPRSACVCAAVLGAALLAGCDMGPMPDAALLKPQAPPKCDARSRRAAPKQPASATTAEPDSDAKVRQLDYEAQCYRHAEMIARNRLGRLQESVEEMVRAKPADAGAKKADPGDADWRNGVLAR